MPTIKMTKHVPDENYELYCQVRMTVIGKIDYWNEKANPAFFAAFKICQQLASENYRKAYYLLSLLYDAKQDSDKSEERARHFAQLAFDWCMANKGNEDVELWCDLGVLYRSQDVANSFEQSAFWFRKAAEQGCSEAQYNLSYAYRFGLGVPEDQQEAIFWCKQAADQGHAMAIANLVHMLRKLAERDKL